MSDVTLLQDEYNALIALAREGATTPDRQRAISDYVAMIDRRNGVSRYYLWVQWQEAGAELPAGTRFPDVWPPELRKKIERTDRPVARADVDAVLRANAASAVEVLVTRDPGAELGWTPYATYFGVVGP